METPPAVETSDQAPDWSSPPYDVLQHIFCAASSWQIPGSCWAAPVCRTWRSAAAGCRGVRLLYLAGHPAADQSFKAWLPHNSQQLEGFVLSCSNRKHSAAVLGALAEAAAAAKASGRPLQLRTLRVLSPVVSMDVARNVSAALPHLRCLQLVDGDSPPAHLIPSQLPSHSVPSWHEVAQSLPKGLEHLSLGCVESAEPVPNLSHLSRLTFLHLGTWRGQRGSFSSCLPPSLQQLEVQDMSVNLSQLQQERAILTSYAGVRGWKLSGEEVGVLHTFTGLRSLSGVSTSDVVLSRTTREALRQLPNLSAMAVEVSGHHRDHLKALARSTPRLVCLQLRPRYSWQPAPWWRVASTQLTRLTVTGAARAGMVEDSAWGVGLGRMPQLRWLSVPAALMAADQACLAEMQQLQVLVLSSARWPTGGAQQVLSQLEWLGEGSLPPHLQVLGLTGMAAAQTARSVRRRLQRRLKNRTGCEVVVGLDLDAVCHPTQQLAGLPLALQQALA